MPDLSVLRAAEEMIRLLRMELHTGDPAALVTLEHSDGVLVLPQVPEGQRTVLEAADDDVRLRRVLGKALDANLGIELDLNIKN